ncbi:MAG: SMI1/KNR4 family protein [Planctomycetota bacterium]
MTSFDVKTAVEVAEKRFDALVLKRALDDIEAWHRKCGTKVSQLLQPPLSSSEIEMKIGRLGIELPEEVRLLYQWKNGSKDAGVLRYPLFWYHHFLSLEQAIGEREKLRANSELGWHANWWPLFDFEGEYYFVECDSKRSALPIMFYSGEDTEIYYAYLNLTTMLETASAILNKDIVKAGDEGFSLDGDVKLIFKEHKRFNDGARFPYQVY